MFSILFVSNSFAVGGYYMIERKSLLQIVVLNTNLMKGGENDEEARRQWDWLNTVLHKIQLNKKTVSEFMHTYIVKQLLFNTWFIVT